MKKAEEKIYKAGNVLWNHMKESFDEDISVHGNNISSALKHIKLHHTENLGESVKAAGDIITSSNLFLGEVAPFVSNLPFAGEILVELIGEVPVARTLLSIQKNTEFTKLQDDVQILENAVNNLTAQNLWQKRELNKIKSNIAEYRAKLLNIRFRLDEHDKKIRINAQNIKILKISLLFCFLLCIIALFIAGANYQRINKNERRLDRLSYVRVGVNGEYNQNGLAQRVEKAIKDNEMFEQSSIYVSQTNSKIILTGYVFSYDLKQKAEDIAKKTKGVSTVDSSNLEIR